MGVRKNLKLEVGSLASNQPRQTWLSRMDRDGSLSNLFDRLAYPDSLGVV